MTLVRGGDGGTTTDPALADAVGRSILRDADGHDLDPDRPEDHLAIVARSAAAERVARDLLGQAVRAARAGGHSWAAIGATLGLSRQAAQQRFGRPSDETSADEAQADGFRWLGPVTAFDEMAELELAGRMGWHTVGAGLFRHKMERTDTQWEHKRVVWRRPIAHYTVDGWTLGCRAFPWLYLVRDLGVRPVDQIGEIGEIGEIDQIDEGSHGGETMDLEPG